MEYRPVIVLKGSYHMADRIFFQIKAFHVIYLLLSGSVHEIESTLLAFCESVQ